MAETYEQEQQTALLLISEDDNDTFRGNISHGEMQIAENKLRFLRKQIKPSL